jgi:sensor histidine kinase YesM
MDLQGVRYRLKELGRWQSVRELLLVSLVVTVIISAFQIKTGPMAMLREVASNFITCAAITLCTALTTSAVGTFRLGRDWKQTIVLVVLLAVGGMLGGLLSWWVNDLLFPYRITHPSVYMLVVAVLAVIFGLSIIAYQNIAERLRETASRLAEKEVREQTLLRLKTEAELDTLRSRVNPHFLFNTLNAVASLIPVDPVKAEEVVQRLSNLFHYVLSAADRGLVPIDDELRIVEAYLRIEQVRLGNRLEYEIDCEDGLGDVVIPSMLLQPLVENGVNYGVAPQRGGGRVAIRCERQGNWCTITVSDSGHGFDPAVVGEGFGLASVRQRLELEYPGNHEFSISTDGGVAIRIAIPITHEA